MELFQKRAQLLIIPMAKAFVVGTGEAEPVVNGGVIQLVGEDQIIFPAEGRQNAYIGVVAGVKEEDCFMSIGLGQIFFKIMGKNRVTGEQAG